MICSDEKISRDRRRVVPQELLDWEQQLGSHWRQGPEVQEVQEVPADAERRGGRDGVSENEGNMWKKKAMGKAMGK